MEHHALAKWKVGRCTLGVILPVMSSDESPVAPSPDPIPSPTLDESMGGAGGEEDGGEEMKEEREEGQEGEEEEEEEKEEEEVEEEEESYVSSKGRVRIAKRKFRALGE
ncbi:unnamed protein product [Ectocarpus sp. 6 AP-2014]